MRRIDKDEGGGEVNEERSELDQHELGRVWIERERVDEWDTRGPGGTDLAQREQLHQPEHEHAEQRQLQRVATEAQVPQRPGVEYPAQQHRERAEIEDAECPAVNGSVRERGAHDG